MSIVVLLSIDLESNHAESDISPKNSRRLRVLFGHVEPVVSVFSRQRSDSHLLRPVHLSAVQAGSHHASLLCEMWERGDSWLLRLVGCLWSGEQCVTSRYVTGWRQWSANCRGRRMVQQMQTVRVLHVWYTSTFPSVFSSLIIPCSCLFTTHRCAGLCALCQKPVTRMLQWCPICGHGGHSPCLQQWFEVHLTCPSGCGHRCSMKCREGTGRLVVSRKENHSEGGEGKKNCCDNLCLRRTNKINSRAISKLKFNQSEPLTTAWHNNIHAHVYVYYWEKNNEIFKSILHCTLYQVVKMRFMTVSSITTVWKYIIYLLQMFHIVRSVQLPLYAKIALLSKIVYSKTNKQVSRR